MKYNRPNIYDMIDSLTIEEKKYLVGYLLDSIRKTEEIVPSLTCLEEQWMKIRRLMKSLDYEPYIDDQVEIEVLQEIIQGEYFDEYGVFDPMKNLFFSLCITKEERISSADMCFQYGSDYMKKEGARIYLKNGKPEKYYEYLERCLSKDGKLYAELVEYYKDKDYKKALEIAELAMKKCKENLTAIVIFLLQDAENKGDNAKFARLMKSAKLRYAINYSEVLSVMGK